METNLATLFEDAMKLCESSDSFYFVDQIGPTDQAQYRTFTYRLASYTEFQQMNALEMRGHTFRLENGRWEIASLPPQKFFNYGEHVGWGTEMDLNTMQLVMDKLDGSLISTVCDANNKYFLKSKTSFRSVQVQEATALVGTDKYRDFSASLQKLTERNYTVNMEYVSPSNQIVIGYSEPQLIVLNVRHNIIGHYLSHERLVREFGEEFVVKSFPIPADGKQFLVDAEKMTGIEGFVIQLSDGLLFKHKTEAYCILHHLKDSINNPKRLWEACVNETADDLRALFKDDPISLEKISAMEALASKNFNHIHKTVHAYYNENKELSRKDYAIKGQEELMADGTFSLVMNLYIGREANVKDFMVKNYKRFGVSDEVVGSLGDD